MQNSKPERLSPLRALLVGAFLASGLPGLIACGDPSPPEQRVRDFINEIEQLAEDRQFTELVGYIDSDYVDTRGNDKLKVVGLLRAFYLRNQSVHLFVRVDEIRIPEPGHAAATVYVAMSRRPLLESEAVQLPATSMHKVDLELVADGDSYRILQTEWTRASGNDVLF